jgi:hypothetical protein
MLALLIRMPAIMQAAAVMMRIVNMDIAWLVALENVTRAQPVPSEDRTRVGFTVDGVNSPRRPRVDQSALFAPLHGAPLSSR